MLTPNGRFELNTKVCFLIPLLTPQSVHLLAPDMHQLHQLCVLFLTKIMSSLPSINSQQTTKNHGNLPGVSERVFHLLHSSIAQLSKLPSVQQQFLAYRVFFPFVGRPHWELVEWTPRYLTGSVWLLCMSPHSTFEPFPKLSLSFVRSRNWVCSRCEKINLECLPDPTPGGSRSEITIPGLLEASSEVEVAQVAEDKVLHTTIMDSSPPPSPRDPQEESLPATAPTVPQTTVIIRSPVSDPRPPLLLDTAICVLLVLALALLFRRFT